MSTFYAHVEITRSALPPLREMTLIEIGMTRKALDISQIIILSLLIATVTPVASRWLDELELALMQLTLDPVSKNFTFLQGATFA